MCLWGCPLLLPHLEHPPDELVPISTRTHTNFLLPAQNFLPRQADGGSQIPQPSWAAASHQRELAPSTLTAPAGHCLTLMLRSQL